ncbi:Inactive sesquithujene synthase [Bienertia sinuspersici]
MLWAYPPTKRQLAATAAGVGIGVTMIAIGAYLSYVNIAPQQARAKARSDFLRQRLRKFLDD